MDHDDNTDLTHREIETYDIVARAANGCSIRHVAATRRVSYPSAYQLVQRLKEKGVIVEEWAPKGNQRLFRAK